MQLKSDNYKTSTDLSRCNSISEEFDSKFYPEILQTIGRISKFNTNDKLKISPTNKSKTPQPSKSRDIRENLKSDPKKYSSKEKFN